MKKKIVLFSFICLILFSHLFTLTGCDLLSSNKGKKFQIEGKEVELNKELKLSAVTFLTSNAFEYINTGNREFLYNLNDDNGKKLYNISISYKLLLFGNTKLLEEDIDSEKNMKDAKDISTEEMKIGKKNWVKISYKKYDEEYGKEIVYHMYYVVHTHISDTDYYKIVFKNADKAQDFEDTFIKSVKFK